jgi:transposase
MFYGMDVHKKFIQVCALDEEGQVQRSFRLGATAADIERFAVSISPADQVVLEATFHTWAIVSIFKERDRQVVVANPMQVKAIAHARIKTDKIDARTLAQLLRAGFIPEVRLPSRETWANRQFVSHRRLLVKERTALKNAIHAVLAQNLIQYERLWLFTKAGLEWVKSVPVTETERFIITNAVGALSDVEARIEAVDEKLTRVGAESEQAKLLMTVPGINVTVAVGLLSAIGDVGRFQTPSQLASYFGLVPSVHQSAERCYHGGITKAGRSTARWLAIEAANQLARSKAPIAGAYHRLRKKKGHNVAVTALARKMTVVVWHMLRSRQPYRYAPPARTRQKLRKVERVLDRSRRAPPALTLEAIYAEARLPALAPFKRGEAKFVAESASS